MSKAHKVVRLLSERVYNKPLLITQDSLNSVLDYLETRKTSITAQEVEASLVEQGIYRSEKMLTDDLAVIPITGSLSYESTFLSAICGLTSYEGLVDDVEEALSMGIKNIIFRADSGGGEAFAMMSTADLIRKMANEKGAKIYTYIDGMAASACYGLVAISDEIIAHPDSQAGSIGVVIQLMNNSEKLKKEGYSRKFITSADSKVPVDEEGEFKPDFIADLKESVDSLHTKFVAHVAKYRPMSSDQINDLKAKVFGSEKSLSLGLIDKVMDHAEFQTYLENIVESSKEPKMPLSFLKRKDSKAKAEDVTKEAALAALTEEDVDMTQLADMQAQLDALLADKAAMESDVAEALALIDEKDAELAAALTKVEALEAEKAEAATNAKKAKLVAVVGEAKADQLFDHISKLDSESYDAVIANLESTNKVLESTDLFKETGVTADVDTTVPKESALARRLRQQAEADKAKKQ